jgi:GNAT superfamily N-acetyltransferase
MTVAIEAYDPKYLEQMTARFNAETADEPHVAPLDPARFETLVAAKTYFDPRGLFVAREAGEVLGWAHACLAPGSESHHDPTALAAQLRLLIYPATRLDVGRELVAVATAWLKASGRTELHGLGAHAGYPFYRGLWFGGEPMGPATMPHVQLALEVGGYKNTHESIFMVAALNAAPAVLQAAEKLEYTEEPLALTQEGVRESWTGFTPMRTRAFLAGTEVGAIGWAVLPHVAARLGAPCMSIWSLWTQEQHRRKGIAAALISRALAPSYAQGARFASVGTQLWNAPAHATYAKFGFLPYRVLVGRMLKLADVAAAS